MAGWLNDLTAAEDPQQALLDSWPESVDDDDTHPFFEPQDLMGLAFSLQRSVLSIMLFQRSVSGLVQEVREHDNLDALFNAIRVDRTVMSLSLIHI